MLRSVVGSYYVGLFALILQIEGVAQAAGPPPDPPADNGICYNLTSDNCASFYPGRNDICNVDCQQVDADGNYPNPSPGGKKHPSGQPAGTYVCPGLWQDETWYQNEVRSPLNMLANQPRSGLSSGFSSFQRSGSGNCEEVKFCTSCQQATREIKVTSQEVRIEQYFRCGFPAGGTVTQQSFTRNYSVTGAGCKKGG